MISTPPNSTARPVGELSTTEKQLVDDCVRLFANPDQGINSGYAKRMATGQTYDEFVASLPD